MKKWISIITTFLLLAAVIIVATGVLNRNAEYTVKSTPAMEGTKQLDNIDHIEAIYGIGFQFNES